MPHAKRTTYQSSYILPQNSLTATEVADSLALQKSGNSFIGTCPVCSYPNALSVDQKDKLLVRCHANHCDFRAIMECMQVVKSQNFPLLTANSAKVANFLAQVDTSKIEYSKTLWNASTDAENTVVQKYLQHRGIKIIPNDIRYTTGLHKESLSNNPIMLCAVRDSINNEIVGVHRTYLTPEGQKANVLPNKKMYGHCSGAAVQLTPAGEAIVIAEGIETALSVLQEMKLPTWAALSSGGIKNLILPPLPLAQSVIIAADADDSGIKAAYDAAARWQKEGREVSIALPPAGKDFNDLLQRTPPCQP